MVGAFRDNEAGSAAGAAYVFVRSGSDWIEEAKLLPSGYGGQFGRSVSLSGDTALVGAPLDGLAGRAYVFVRSASTWTEQAQLELDHFGDFDGIGRAVSLSGDLALVGAPVIDYKGSGPGAAYVFARHDGIWSLEAKLLGSETGDGAFFGGAVSLSASRALIGARGGNRAYVFVRDTGGWSEEAKLQPRQGGQAYGVSVSLWEDRVALVGDPAINPPYSARAHVYELDPIELSVVGSCPGAVDVTIPNAPPDSEVMVIVGSDRRTDGGAVCGGTALEVAEPFQWPPLWIRVDGSGSGSGNLNLDTDRCWLEALAVESCSTSRAVRARSQMRSPFVD